jgi:hypothetical protein
MSEDLQTETVSGYTIKINEAAIVVAADGEAALLIPKPQLNDIAMNLANLPEPFAMLAALYIMIMDKPEILSEAMQYVASKNRDQETATQLAILKGLDPSVVH